MMQLSSEHLIEQFKFNTFFKNKFLSKIYKEEYWSTNSNIKY